MSSPRAARNGFDFVQFLGDLNYSISHMTHKHKCKLYCRKCGKVMKTKFSKEQQLAEGFCEFGEMKLNSAAIDYINRNFLKNSEIKGSTQYSWLKAPLYCPCDGTMMKQEERQGDMVRTSHTCTQCEHSFSSGLILSLVQNHLHKNEP